MVQRFLKLLLVQPILAVFLFSCNKQKEKRPNFLFVLVDDQSPFDLKICLMNFNMRKLFLSFKLTGFRMLQTISKH